MGALRKIALRLAGVVVLGLLVAACDKCGNFYSFGGSLPAACKSDTASPR
jgi:hypothetical protein